MPTPLDALRDVSSQFRRLERRGSKAVLFLTDDPATALYRVVTGCVKLLRSMPDGRCQILRFCGPEQVFGWTGNPSHNYAAEAVNDVSLESIDAAHLNRRFCQLSGQNTRWWASSMFQTYKLLCFAPKADRTYDPAPRQGMRDFL